MKLRDLLAPRSLEEFEEHDYERRPLFLRGSSPSRYRGLLGREDFELLLWTHEQELPDLLRVVRPGRKLEAPRSVDAKERFSWAVQRFLEGWTLVLAELEKRWAPTALLSRDVVRFCRGDVSAKAFLTPGGQQGFKPHFDCRDIFVLQLEGSKLWRIYGRPVELPLLRQSRIPTREELGGAREEHLLEPGDLLYLPRGFVHAAQARDGDSLHLTVGFRPRRRIDLLSETLQWIVEQEPELRRSVPLDGPDESAWCDAVERVAAHLGSPGVLERGAARCEQGLVSRLRALPDGQLEGIELAASLTPDDRLEKRAGSLCHVSSRGADRVGIVFPGLGLEGEAELQPGAVEGPAFIAPALRFVAAAEGAFAVSDLPGLTPDGQMVLARRLVREGLLKPLATGAIPAPTDRV